MAVVNTKSTELTNRDAGTRNDVHDIGGRLKIKSATIASAAGDDDGSTYRFFRVGSGHSIKSLKIYHDAISSATDIDVGLYDINGGAVVDGNVYDDADNLTSASTGGTEIRFDDADITGINNKVWEDLGLTADSQKEYDVVVTGNTVGAGGDITLVMLYTAGD